MNLDIDKNKYELTKGKSYDGTSLASNEQEIKFLKEATNQKSDASFLCATIKDDNPNYLAIIYANEKFCKTFRQNNEDLIGKSYDFLFDGIDVNYSSDDQLEYIRMVKSIKDKKECSIVLKLDNHIEDDHQITKFKVKFEPCQKEGLKKFYAILSFEIISEEVIENESLKRRKQREKEKNEGLVKTLERSLSNEKLLREVSYLIISDKPVEEIARSIAKSICDLLKTDRCLIHDRKDGKTRFIVEYSSAGSKSIINNKKNEEQIFEAKKVVKNYVDFQNIFYKKIKGNSSRSSIFIANDIGQDSSFSKIREICDKYDINSQITAITSFDNEVNGGIYIHSSQNRDYTIDEIELIEIIADQLSIAIDRSYSIEKVMVANHSLLKKTLELKESIKKEKAVRKMQTEFVALVSHEFKTPLQIMDSTRELISRKLKSLEIKDESFDKYLAKIKGGISRMTGLINSTLNLAKMENGQTEIRLEKSEFDIHELLEEIVEKTSNLILSKNINVSKDFCSKILKINADKKLIDHCFTNIISNAIKYSKDDTNVKIITKSNENKIAIKVIDRGIGIPKEEISKVGQKFFRANNTLSVSGTGIGIYLTKSFIELHNGMIKIDSELNKGTSFTIILPK